MKMSIKSKDGSIHATDERINTITHMVAACFALLGAALLISQASVQGHPWKIVALSIYSLSIICLFVFSALHHGVNGSPKLNKIFRTFDYNAVFFLIASTVTPLVLVLYFNVFGWTVLGVVWVIAVLGITLRSAYCQLPKYITNTLYIVLGWLPIVLISTDIKLPVGALLLLVRGGIIYSVGFVIYVIEKPNFKKGIFGFHELWHFLVIIAALLHYLLIYFYVLPK